MLKLAVLLSLTTTLFAPDLMAQDDKSDAKALAARVATLEATIAKLAAVVEGTAKPVNLARTNLAAVSASSVNGGRSLANGFYGILNAFDDGTNVINGLSYTYWLTSGEPSPWVKIHFDTPVSLTSLFVEGGPRFTARLSYEKGGERDFTLASDRLKFTTPEHGVRSVRLTFQGGANVRVNEVRVMGYSPGAPVKGATPRLALDRHHALLVAQAAFTQWRSEQLSAPSDTRIEETADGYKVTVLLDGLPILQVTVDRRTGQTTRAPLAKWTALSRPGRK